ncbi:MAG: phosphatidylglycerophosphatase A [Candidatus Eisenbacteria sp.]|nr:phosphatidylglycerophosphatase A [Candidatus Eisenbacteria bacterium]
MRKLALVLATGLGTGYSPFAPGTAGALLAAGLYWLFPDSSRGLDGALPLMVAIVAGFFVGVWAAQETEKVYGHDAGRIVIDEVVGMWVVMLWVPKTWNLLIVGFFLCRFFDIVKPFPAGRSQSLRGGWGVMVDDVIAGIYGNLVLQVLWRGLGWM